MGSLTQALGIGMNYGPGRTDGTIGKLLAASTWTSLDPIKESAVRKPSDTIIFADAGQNALPNPTPANADDWYDESLTVGGGSCLLRCGGPGFPKPDAVAIPRHNKRVHLGFVDGLAEAMQNSAFGYGLSKTDPRARWSIYH